ncbi:MAG TPA: hypothetical protein VMG60_23730 [Burkholderiaceae bacterium]|nr:hypothetical protein [Burkholderiaceae bacterium]
MQRRISNVWLVLLWIPVLALVLGLVAGCAATDSAAGPVPARPSHDDLQRLVAQELDTDSRFDSFAASESADARQVAAIFQPILADVNAIDCRAAPGQSVDCTLEVVMRFPGLDGRESRTYWERRLRQVEGNWQVVGLTQP